MGPDQRRFIRVVGFAIVGFGVAALIFFLLRVSIKDERIFKPADQQPPPWWVRGVLVLTCTGVSFAHGTNDGQKGMGLLMLVLIVVLPSALALNPNLTQQDVHQLVEQLNQGIKYVQTKSQNRQPPATADATKVLTSYDSASGKINNDVFPALSVKMTEFRSALAEKNSIQDLPFPERQQQRQNGYLISEAIQKLRKEQAIGKADLQELGTSLKKATEYIPIWIKAVVATSLGLGTMIGWKRIVVTVAERIGKSRLGYGQGASAELTTMATILFADRLGLPVSTTHVLTSGIAGTMVANKAGVQRRTVRNIVLAWVLTLPVCIFLGAVLFAAALFVFFNLLGWK